MKCNKIKWNNKLIKRIKELIPKNNWYNKEFLLNIQDKACNISNSLMECKDFK